MSSGRAAAFVVFDLAFGDSGKGTIVDYLVRSRAATLVVRWNGGAQAGHAVVTDDGREHVFSQFGAGTFVPGVRTHLSEAFVLHPTALLVEAQHLARCGVSDALRRLTVAASARVITPFHQAANRLRELGRGAQRHGTCGVGFGEAVRDSLTAPDAIVRAGDLFGDAASLSRKLEATRRRVTATLEDATSALRGNPSAEQELAVLLDPAVTPRWIDMLAPLRATPAVLVPDDALGPMLQNTTVVLEGAQGILLDERHGFHPHTTWSDCTPAAAARLLRTHGFAGSIARVGVLRTYMTRHGAGPFPSEDAALAPRLPEAHNASAGWQGRFRVGPLDLVLLRYARKACGEVDALALTHADRAHVTPNLVTAYEKVTEDSLFVHDARGRACDVRGAHDELHPLAHQERLGRALSEARPVVEAVDAHVEGFVQRLETDLGVPVGIVSHGPTAAAKRTRPSPLSD